MKTQNVKQGLLVGLIVLGGALAVPSFAKETGKVHSSHTTESHVFNDTTTRFGFGMTTYGGSAVAHFAPALDVWYEIGNLHSLQLLGAISSSNPFLFSVGAVYRYNLVGDQTAGFHAGLGLNMGLTGVATSTYFLNIFPVIGFHFGLGGLASNVVLSFDGGPLFAVTPGFQFVLNSSSAVCGAAINYFF